MRCAITLCVVAVCSGLFLGSSASAFGECRDVTADVRTRIEEYVQKQYEFAIAHISKTSTDQHTCYSTINFAPLGGTRPLTLYLSPDQHFLFSTIMDLAIDPSIQKREAAAEALRVLSAGDRPTQGRLDAPVVLIEFGDFQCPYCSRFAGVFAALPLEERSKVRLTYRQMPLPMHSWAEKAAEVSACVYLADHDAFWMLHDYIFREQQSLKPESLESQLLTYSGDVLHLDKAALRGCLESKNFSTIIKEDAELAEKYHVFGTPTIFLNGKETLGFATTDKLVKAIDDAYITAIREKVGTATASTNAMTAPERRASN